MVRGSVEAGVSGYLVTDCPASELEAAIRQVYAGGSAFAPEVKKRMMPLPSDVGM